MTNWTGVAKPTNTSWTGVPKATGINPIVVGSPIGLLLSLTYAATIGGTWTKITKASGQTWTKVAKAT